MDLRYLLGGIFIALGAAAPAQADAVRMARSLPTGIELGTERGSLTIEPWSEFVVHVRFGPEGYAGNYNPAVIAQPGKVRFEVKQTTDGWMLSTARLQVH